MRIDIYSFYKRMCANNIAQANTDWRLCICCSMTFYRDSVFFLLFNLKRIFVCHHFPICICSSFQLFTIPYDVLLDLTLSLPSIYHSISLTIQFHTTILEYVDAFLRRLIFFLFRILINNQYTLWETSCSIFSIKFLAGKHKLLLFY